MKTMKSTIGMLMGAVMALTATSCTQQEEVNNVVEEEQAMTLTSSVATMRTVSQNLQTVQIAEGVQTGLFIVKDGATTSTGNNNLLTADGSGGFTATTQPTWPKSGSVSIYAYAPYNADYTLGSNTFSVAEDQGSDQGYLKSDLLFGTPLAGNPLEKTVDGSVALKFVHKLTKINLNFVLKEEGFDLKGATVSVMNTLPSVQFTATDGTLSAASGTATTIKAATFATDATSFKASVVIVPQTIEAGTTLIKMEGTDKTMIARLGSNVTFESGKLYSYTINVGSDGVEMTLGNANISDWDDETTPLESTAEEYVGPVTYGVGDYLLADGTLVKASALGDQTPAAIIFSTTVSETDAAAGYNAYAMALKRYTNRKQISKKDGSDVEIASGANTATSMEELVADLDGRTSAINVLAGSYYAALSDAEKAENIYNLSGYSTSLSGDNNSGWFLPSIGQFVQMLNAFGSAGITSTLAGASWSNYGVTYTSASEEATTLVANIKQTLGLAENDNLFAVGNIVYATSTENGTNNGKNKIIGFSIAPSANVGTGDTAETRTNVWQLNTSVGRGTNNRSVIPVTAVKLPTEE